MEFAAGLTLLQFSGDLRCGCAPRKYCNPVEQQQNLVARGLRDSCIGLQTCDVFEQPTPALPFVSPPSSKDIYDNIYFIQVKH